ncbi:MAG: aminotransferase class V-fold PLP-dependent enzyme [Deltaproteobacteria bacterium]|nr:aminotransferase class V-fold PLP-dependent enzyme [Deltaproteobacteria bacterium]
MNHIIGSTLLQEWLGQERGVRVPLKLLWGGIWIIIHFYANNLWELLLSELWRLLKIRFDEYQPERSRQAPVESMNIAAYRKFFPVTENLVYLNHAAVAPLSTQVVEKVTSFLEEYREFGSLHYARWMEYMEEVRGMAASLISAERGEIAFVKNTSSGLSTVANGIAWERGDNIITADCEFPSNVYPWMNLAPKGVELRLVKERGGRIQVGDIEKLIDDRTRLLSISWVEFVNGFRNDLKALGDLCEARKIYFCVDGIQGLGALDMNVEEFKIDFLAADGHKWLLAPEGIGIFYVSRRVIDELHPSQVGWHSVTNPSNYLPYNFEFRDDARRFEEGSPNMMGIYALGASLETLLEIGTGRIEETILSLTGRIASGLMDMGHTILTPFGDDERSGILLFTPAKGSVEGLYRHLSANRILCAIRPGGIRLSPHFYNNEEDVERLLKVVAEYRGKVAG